MQQAQQFIRWFSEIDSADIALVGGKNSALGEMYQAITEQGVPVPDGFALTTSAYRLLLKDAGLEPLLREMLEGFDVADPDDLERRCGRCRDLICAAEMPRAVREQVDAAFAKLQDHYGAELTVAVRSSATAEDLPTASFAGQHDSFLNVDGAGLVDACQRCIASLFTTRAVRYRADHGFDHFQVALSVGVMKMVRADQAVSGVMFTLDTETGFPDVVLITSAYGLGENVVQGTVDPDEFYVHKPTFRLGYRGVLRRILGSKQRRMIYADPGTQNVVTSERDQRQFSLTDEQVLQLAEYALLIEAHFSERAGRWVPMDIEWAKDGQDGGFYIVQARPETVSAGQSATSVSEYVLTAHADATVVGRAVGTSIATGVARVIGSIDELSRVRPGDVIVAESTAPDWGVVLKTAGALVTNRGGRTCHAAIVAREVGIPAVIGCGDATQRIEDGATVTVSCAQGEQGAVYAGLVPYEVRTHDLMLAKQRPRTKMMVNLGNPGLAFKIGALPNDGVGLARLEFIINSSVRVHPMALLHPEQVDDADELAQIMELVEGYPDAASYFVDKLAEGVATIAAAVYPNPAVVRFSDFKTNEYADLLGGSAFEPVEANPMIGFRGASRYAHPSYRDGFALECRALKKVREELGLRNVKVMVPFCRRVEEAQRVLEIMAQNGLARGEAGLEVYVMCEIPNNVISIDAFAEHFDGFSIGSNDLTQLVLGVDRDSELVAFDFDERDPGVMEMFRQAIQGAHRNGCHVGFCGQAVSDYPEVAEYLIGLGIDSVSLTADRLVAATAQVAEVERRMKSARS